MVGALVAIVVVAGGWYYWSMMMPAPAPESPSGMMGTNGSENQGNMGQPSGGAMQEPKDTGIIGSNLALGTNSNASLGTYLIGYNGMTVYSKSNDTTGVSSCYDACAQNWPPYVVSPTDNIHQLKAGVMGAVAVAVRTDGKLQLTYNGKPLYFYVGDASGSDARGQGMGGVWMVVKP